MSFENHLFISYAHVDNKPTSDDSKGWVTRFHECLESYLSHNVGENAKIWRDAKLRGNDEFGPEIDEQLPRSAVLLSVLSPKYFDSEWCVREVNKFCEHAKQSTGLKVGNKVRVFRVLTKSLDRTAFEVFPDLKDRSTGYEFFHQDERNREAWLDPELGTGIEYRTRIYHLADEIADLVRGLETNGEGTPGHDDDNATVYLAECSYDRREDREKVAGSLRSHGYRIVPDGYLPDVESEYVDEVGRLLEQCDLSVHIIGGSYGAVPDGSSGMSKVAWQNELAARRSAASGLKRLIWLPRDTKVENEQQESFIEALRQNPDTQLGADLIEADLETLKGTMHRSLLNLGREQQGPALDQSPGEKTVYVVCASCDRAATIDLRKFLKHRGYRVEIPVFEGDSATVRKANETRFNAADAVIVFYGEADEAWRATTESELRRLSGLREGASPTGSFTFLAGPETIDKTEMIELEEEGVINGLSGFRDEIMTDFVAKVSA